MARVSGAIGLLVYQLLALALLPLLLAVFPLRIVAGVRWHARLTRAIVQPLYGVYGVLLHYYCGLSFRVTADASASNDGDISDDDHPTLVLANHQRMSDPALLTLFVLRAYSNPVGCSVQWSGLLKFNPASWLDYLRGGVAWVSAGKPHEEQMRSILRSIAQPRSKRPWDWFAMFPEGAISNEKLRRQSREWAEKKGLAKRCGGSDRLPLRLMVPRLGAFSVCLEELPLHTTIVDCTIGYSRQQMQLQRVDSMLDFLSARRPRTYSIHLRKYNLSEVKHSQDPHVWLTAWARGKDALLDAFDKEGSFPGRVLFEGKTPRSYLVTLCAFYAAEIALEVFCLQWFLISQSAEN